MLGTQNIEHISKEGYPAKLLRQSGGLNIPEDSLAEVDEWQVNQIIRHNTDEKVK
jgi:hypothetical protein